MKAQEIRDLNAEEITLKMKESKEKLFKLQLKLNTKQLENTSQIKALKQDISRMMTILNQKKGAKANAGKK